MRDDTFIKEKYQKAVNRIDFSSNVEFTKKMYANSYAPDSHNADIRHCDMKKHQKHNSFLVKAAVAACIGLLILGVAGINSGAFAKIFNSLQKMWETSSDNYDRNLSEYAVLADKEVSEQGVNLLVKEMVVSNKSLILRIKSTSDNNETGAGGEPFAFSLKEVWEDGTEYSYDYPASFFPIYSEGEKIENEYYVIYMNTGSEEDDTHGTDKTGKKVSLEFTYISTLAERLVFDKIEVMVPTIYQEKTIEYADKSFTIDSGTVEIEQLRYNGMFWELHCAEYPNETVESNNSVIWNGVLSEDGNGYVYSPAVWADGQSCEIGCGSASFVSGDIGNGVLHSIYGLGANEDTEEFELKVLKTYVEHFEDKKVNGKPVESEQVGDSIVFGNESH